MVLEGSLWLSGSLEGIELVAETEVDFDQGIVMTSTRYICDASGESLYLEDTENEELCRFQIPSDVAHSGKIAGELIEDSFHPDHSGFSYNSTHNGSKLSDIFFRDARASIDDLMVSLQVSLPEETHPNYAFIAGILRRETGVEVINPDLIRRMMGLIGSEQRELVEAIWAGTYIVGI